MSLPGMIQTPSRPIARRRIWFGSPGPDVAVVEGNKNVRDRAYFLHGSIAERGDAHQNHRNIPAAINAVKVTSVGHGIQYRTSSMSTQVSDVNSLKSMDVSRLMPFFIVGIIRS